jgi:hypothetical protein
MEFREFPKIPRLNREVVITEKIDGTNACVVVSDDGTELAAQSRSRIIVPGADNFGFAAWAYANAEFLKTTLGPGYHFGEWWGAGIQRRYGMERKWFSLFNVERWKGLRDYDKAQEIGLSVVPQVLVPGTDGYVITLGDVDTAIKRLRSHGSFAAPGFMDPEGVVVFHCASRSMFKVTCKDDEKPKGQT